MDYNIYIDESGSYNDFQTRYYVVSAIISNSKKSLENLHKNIALKIKKKQENSELKASRLSDFEKSLFINEMIENEIEIYSLVLDKKKLKEINRYTMSEIGMNNLMIIELLNIILKNFKQLNHIIIYNDQRSVSPLAYYDLETHLNVTFYNKVKLIDVIYKDSSLNRTIQLVDYISNVVFGKYNKTNKGYLHVKNIEKLNIIELLGEK
ncbi:DUF3800 domain-containing protein [Mycoplasma sp. P36-A1]|uniref:DUF3800 domain-containing protein n=1 Tax=Mycoplasma sp. P36-A1 TaxID=3252900 RepID=UPI003C306DE1